MNNIQRAFVTSWEDIITNELTTYLNNYGYIFNSAVLNQLSDKGMEIVNEISWDIPENTPFTGLKKYNDDCSEKLKIMVAGLPCTC